MPIAMSYRLIVGALLSAHLAATNALVAETKPMVYAGEDGRLIYTPDRRGNRILDFSRCGYGVAESVFLPCPFVRR